MSWATLRFDIVLVLSWFFFCLVGVFLGMIFSFRSDYEDGFKIGYDAGKGRGYWEGRKEGQAVGLKMALRQEGGGQ